MGRPIAEARERQTRAVELRMAGRPYEEIATELGYSGRAAAWRAVNDALARRECDAVEQMRAIEGDRLDSITKILWPLVESGDLEAVDRMLRVMDRRAKLFGLDLAGRVEAATAAAVDLDGTVARLLVAVSSQRVDTTDNAEPEVLELEG